MTISTAGDATVAQRVVDCLRRFDVEGLAALYRPDALRDANVPTWRYQLQGASAVAEQLREELAPAAPTARVGDFRVIPLPDGVLVEMEVHFVQEGEDRMWREAHRVRTDGEGIAEHVSWCTGVWDAATIARHAVEAPMVRR